VIFNPPGRTQIDYRAGDYVSFRHVLLRGLPGETELTRVTGGRLVQLWRPGARGDLAVQMIEWWAYLADVLTFYNEQIAGEAYLRTAGLPESVNRLIRLLGYRPRPGIGATGLLAAVLNPDTPVTLPKGFAIQSKPGPGKEPQVFELDAEVRFGPQPGAGVGAGAAGSGGTGTGGAAPPAVPAGLMEVVPPPDPQLVQLGTDKLLTLKGSVSSVRANDVVLLVSNLDPPGTPQFAPATVAEVIHAKDPPKRPITQVKLRGVATLGATTDVTHYSLYRSDQSSPVWPHPAGPGRVVRMTGGAATIDLASVARDIKPGEYVTFETGDPLSAKVGSVTGYEEPVWYANPVPPPPAADPVPENAPTASGSIPIPIPHTRFTFTSDVTGIADDRTSRPTFLVRHGWKKVGDVVARATGPGGIATTGGAGGGGAGGGSAGAGTPVIVTAPPGTSFPALGAAAPVLVEDAAGRGSVGRIDSGASLHLVDPPPFLKPPLRALFNLLPVSRGKSVNNEVLGSGNAAAPGQDFVLQNAPVTYLAGEPKSGEGYGSTVRVWVDGLEWKEAPTFYGRAKDEQVFVTREDDDGKTHVTFGDGENGARLPTGANNVVARYRYGSGGEAPAAGTLTVVLEPRPGLKSVRNPVPVGGGADPDPPAKVRRLAPRSVLTFGRAVSVDDFEAIAASAPGVARAKAAVSFDALAQRPRVTVWVGDDAGAVAAARAAVAGASDPNRLPKVVAATGVPVALRLVLLLDPRRERAAVLAAARAALLDPDAGVFGTNVVRIGRAVFESEVFAACLAVEGVKAVRALEFVTGASAALNGTSTQSPGPTPCGDRRHDPGPGGFFFVPDDPQHLDIQGDLAP
jgi:hypothetical protein